MSHCLSVFVFFTLFLLLTLSINPVSSRNNFHGGNGNRGRDIDDDEVIAVELKGGICGQGENYTYFIRPGDSQYVAFIFRGWGFCYSDETCSTANTIIDIDTNIAILSESSQFDNSEPFDTNSLKWTLILLDQCTEDFHIGMNSVYLGTTVNTFHFQGGYNVNLIFESILNNSNSNGDTYGDSSSSSSSNGRHRSSSSSSSDSDSDDNDDNDNNIINRYVNFDSIKHLIMMGSSSGGYGAAIWSNKVFDYVSDDTLKTLIIDSWWLNRSLALSTIPSLVSLFNAVNSPAISDEFVEIIQNGGDMTLENVVAMNLEKYCGLFVSFLNFETDSVLSYYHYFFTGDVRWFDTSFWQSTFYNAITTGDVYSTLDSKRVSSYIAQGRGHILLLNESWSQLSVKCEEAPSVVDYLSDVVGGKSLVRNYYGKTTYRVRDFPKTWNNIDIECLQCD